MVDYGGLRPDQKELLFEAKDALKLSYSPYSKFAVGASIRTVKGRIICGSNVENAASPSGICAERSALVRANAEGSGECCTSIAVVASYDGGVTKEVTAPCGTCRQCISEFSIRSGVGEEFEIILASTDFSEVKVITIGDLLPLSFGPSFNE